MFILKFRIITRTHLIWQSPMMNWIPTPDTLSWPISSIRTSLPTVWQKQQPRWKIWWEKLRNQVLEKILITKFQVVCLFLLFMLREQKILSCLFLALASYKGLYPIMLIAPLCVVLLEKMSNKTAFKIITRVVIPCSILLGSFLAGLLWISYIVMDKNWNFLWSTYGFILSVPGTVNRKCYVVHFSKL